MQSIEQEAVKSAQRLHYGWVIVLVGTLTIFACLGLARFAFGMLLPSMSGALQMSYDEMGFLGTVNFAGYLVAVALSPLLLRRFSPRQLIASGLLLISACMYGISAGSSYLMILGLYGLVGVGSGDAGAQLLDLHPVVEPVVVAVGVAAPTGEKRFLRCTRS